MSDGDPKTSEMAPASVGRLDAFSGTDLDDLCEAAEAAIPEGGFGWTRVPPRHVIESYWKGVLLVPERSLFVARLDGALCGAAQLLRPPRHSGGQSFSAHLTTTFVMPWARRRGLGRRLIEAVEGAARRAGMAILNADIRATQLPAIALYESLGYIRWGTHPAYARVAGEVISGHFYFKRLAAP